MRFLPPPNRQQNMRATDAAIPVGIYGGPFHDPRSFGSNASVIPGVVDRRRALRKQLAGQGQGPSPARCAHQRPVMSLTGAPGADGSKGRHRVGLGNCREGIMARFLVVTAAIVVGAVFVPHSALAQWFIDVESGTTFAGYNDVRIRERHSPAATVSIPTG
jgi:hypothetical protein